MFKRVEKRRRKKEEEELLGIDDDMKEVMGMHDTDSEESDSDSDSDADSGSEAGSDAGGSEGGFDFGDEGSDTFMDEEEVIEEEEDDGGSESEDEDPEVTVAEALKDPVYIVSLEPDVRACIVCPGKLLKGSTMVDLHRTSNAHTRRLKQFLAHAKGASPKESAWGVLKRAAEEKPKPILATPLASSKRAGKKAAQQQKWKERREKNKAKKVKKATQPKETGNEATDPTPSSSTPKVKPSKKDLKPTDATLPPKKKRKTAAPTNDELTAVAGSSEKSSKSKSKSKDAKSSATKLTPGAAIASATPPSKGDINVAENAKKTKTKAQEELPAPQDEHVERKEAVKSIARSATDRARNARSRAMSMSKGGDKKTKKVAAVS